MSNLDILAAVQAGKMTPAQADAALAEQRNPARTIKANKNGGLFVRDTSFVAHSSKKSKDYTASANIDRVVAAKLFQLDPKTGKPCDLLAAVCAYVANGYGKDADAAIAAASELVAA